MSMDMKNASPILFIYRKYDVNKKHNAANGMLKAAILTAVLAMDASTGSLTPNSLTNNPANIRTSTVAAIPSITANLPAIFMLDVIPFVFPSPLYTATRGSRACPSPSKITVISTRLATTVRTGRYSLPKLCIISLLKTSSWIARKRYIPASTMLNLITSNMVLRLINHTNRSELHFLKK